MSEAKHTPGPWVSAVLCSNSGWVDIRGKNRVGNYIAYATPKCNGSPDERGDVETIANARLISAAPDLLEACSAWIAYMDDPAGGSFDDEAKLHEAMRAAIAKATGAP